MSNYSANAGRTPANPTRANDDHWKDYYNYRIPAYKKAKNPQAYSPQLASIGPYHSGEPDLQAMEEHKARALQRFLLGGSIGIHECFNALQSKVDELISSYQSLGEEWKGSPHAINKFLRLMVKDGVFLYEFMRGYPDGVGWEYYDKQDPIFSVRGLRNIPNIVADILMLENQLPITVLERLIAVETRDTDKEYHEEVNKLVLKFLSAKLPFANMTQPLGLHVLDISRKVLAPLPSSSALASSFAQNHRGSANDLDSVQSAINLDDVGVEFRTNDIFSFDITSGTLSLPPLTFDATTKPRFLNAIAFECLHQATNNEVSSYIAFLQKLIASPSDVAFLRSKELIQSEIGGDQAVDGLIKTIYKNVVYHPSSNLSELRDNLNKYYMDNFNHRKKYCIYRIPAAYKAQNPGAYSPHMASIGPYYHGAPDLQAMEEHKARALQQFLNRWSIGINVCYEALASKVDELISSYHSLSSNQSLVDERTKEDSKRKFLMLMVKDGVFLYEFMRGYPDGVGWDYDKQDPVFSVRALRNNPVIVADILMLENQLPITVLERLIAVEKGDTDKEHHEEVNKLVLKFFSATPPSSNMTQPLGLHVLDISRKVLAPLPYLSAQIQMGSPDEPDFRVESAIKLDNVGVKFSKNQILSFDIINGTLSLPPLTFDTTTEHRFLNAIAFESLHPGTNNEVSSYIAFLQELIASPSDVAFLQSKELIQSKISDDQAVDGLMKTISKNEFYNPSSIFYLLRDELNKYYNINQWKKYYIYRIPAAYKQTQRPGAYSPQLTSIGPYHNGEPGLQAMEEHKARALQRFRGGSIAINDCCNALKSKVDELICSYQSLGEEWKGSPPAIKKFLMLMVKDGVFLYEFMRGYPDGDGWNYDDQDPVFSVRALRNIPNIVADILMLENQLPITVLERLIAVEKGDTGEEYHEEVNKLVLKFLKAESPSADMTQPLGLHVLDISRKVLAPLPPPSAQPPPYVQTQIAPLPSPSALASPSAQIQMFSWLNCLNCLLSPAAQLARAPTQSAQIQMGRAKERVKSAINLDEVGVKFGINEGLLFDINNSTLSLPPLTFDTTTEPRFLNAIAFECLHPATKNEVSSYIAFMQGLIDSPRDVEFLRSKEFIQSKIGDDHAVDGLMKSISTNVLFDPSSYLCVLRDDLNKYYIDNMGKWRRRLREWRRVLHQNYLKNPWTIIAIVSTIIILLLTALQTGYTVKQAK